MAPEPAERHTGRRRSLLRGRRLSVVAVTAPIVILLAATLTAAAPPSTWDSMPGAPEQTVGESPNYRRVSLSTPGATIEIFGQLEPFTTGGITGEVDLARPEGNQAMVAANLVASSDELADFGQVYLAMRPGTPVDYQYDTSIQSIIFNPGIEFKVDMVPGLSSSTDFLYTQPIRMLPTEPVANPLFPPYEQTFAIPSLALLWEGEAGVTGSEPIGIITEFELTITHPG
ncbi:hypothetical protein [Glycomyces sp. YM15]|uniref:hypothetical protein n=1 Tax=Glycomyces sp. YM15 TaxID=2800446 RepID=UPI001966CA7F|nr:hypothetical protein [Glycomyces sp. YM15]